MADQEVEPRFTLGLRPLYHLIRKGQSWTETDQAGPEEDEVRDWFPDSTGTLVLGRQRTRTVHLAL